MYLQITLGLQKLNEFRLNCLKDPQFILKLKSETNQLFCEQQFISLNNINIKTSFGKLDFCLLYFHPISGSSFNFEQLCDDYSYCRKYEKSRLTSNNINKTIIQPNISFKLAKLLLSPINYNAETYKKEIYLEQLSQIVNLWSSFQNNYSKECAWLISLYSQLATTKLWSDDLKFKMLIYSLVEPFHFAALCQQFKKYSGYKHNWFSLSTLFILEPLFYFPLNDKEINEILIDPHSHSRLLAKINDTIYFYDPDECSDFYKVSIILNYLFNPTISIKNLLNGNPIQVETDDAYCLFWSLRMMYILNKNLDKNLNKNKLRKIKKKLKTTNIVKWTGSNLFI